MSGATRGPHSLTHLSDSDCDRLYTLALENHRAGRIAEAINLYRAVIAARPAFASACNNLGNALFSQGNLDAAIASYGQALAVNSEYPDAHYNLGNVLAHQGKLEAAAASFRRALACKPDFAKAWYNLGLNLCEKGLTEQGFTMFSRHAELVYGTPNGMRHRNEPYPPHKLLHDQEQANFLASGNSNRIGRTLEDTYLIEGGSRLQTPAINPHCGVDNIAKQWRQNRPQVVVIDDFLCQKALDRLRRFCWGSTIWRKVYEDGYLGATPEHGFACPLMAQIADELRSSFPTIFDGQPLRYLWAFKYDSKLTGTKLHADEAAVNVNFWITPDEANLNPKSGGLIIWDAAAPLDWSPAKYNSDVAASRAFLTQAGSHPMTVEYRSNRAVIFDSDLFHETDKITFKDGYCNRRINVTLLFGRRRSGKKT